MSTVTLPREVVQKAIDALEAAQSAGEPVAWRYFLHGKVALETQQLDHYHIRNGSYVKGEPLYTHPAPQVPMTEADADKLLLKVGILANLETLREIIRATEAHHNIGVKP